MLDHSIVSQHFMKPEGSIPNSQKLSTCSYFLSVRHEIDYKQGIVRMAYESLLRSLPNCGRLRTRDGVHVMSVGDRIRSIPKSVQP
jgi:hypothetical protein